MQTHALMPIPQGRRSGMGAQEGVYSEGEIYPERQSEMLQAQAGVAGARSMGGFRPLAPFGSSPDGIGLYQPRQVRGGSLGTLGSPLLGAIQAIARRKRGLGDDGASAAAPVLAGGLLVAAVALGLVVTGTAGYYVGKAVAPSSSQAPKYAWWGVASALVLGPLGLGIEAAVALNHKGG